MYDASEPLARIVAILNALLPGGLWCAWWLWGVDWSKLWPVLARGAWAPVVLLMLVSGVVWARLDPVECRCLGFAVLPPLWWHLGAVAALGAIALVCGWLQGVLNWSPPEIAVEPPPLESSHGHGFH